MFIRAFIFGIGAFLATVLLLGPPVEYEYIGRSTPYPLAVVAAISAILSSLLLTKFGVIPKFKRLLIQGVITGLVTVIFAHIIFGPISYLYSLAAGHYGHVELFKDLLFSLGAAIWIISVGYITVPIGILSGIFVEYLLVQKGSNKSFNPDGANNAPPG